jgi:hypothetical protein
MPKISSIYLVAALGTSLVPLQMSPLEAHQQKMTSNGVAVTIHLEPKDSPYVGKPTLTWFMLAQRSGEMIAPATCNCRVVAYAASKQGDKPTWTSNRLPLSTMDMAGHKKGHQAIRTNITFPKPGAYTVVLSGQSKNGSFQPFEMKFPITVRS